MVTKTGSSAGFKLAAFVSVIVLMGFGYGLVKKTDSDERAGVLFTVTFKEVSYQRFIDIIVLVDGKSVLADKTVVSPWDTVVQLERGQTATLKATQAASSNLSCAVNGDVQETRTFPGTVTCIHKRV